MKKTTFSFLLFAFTFLYTTIQGNAFPTMFSGTIHIEQDKVCSALSTTALHVEPIAIYYLGRCIKSEIHADNPGHITFDIPRDNDELPSTFYLVITEKCIPVCKKSNHLGTTNTMDYWKVANGYKALFYSLTLKQVSSKTDQKNTEPEYEWVCQKKEIPEDRRIPDDAIIIQYDPDLVKELRGGDQIQLPTIVIKQCPGVDLEELHLRLQMDSLDTRAFHAPDKHVMTHHKDKESTLLILPIT